MSAPGGTGMTAVERERLEKLIDRWIELAKQIRGSVFGSDGQTRSVLLKCAQELEATMRGEDLTTQFSVVADEDVDA